MGNTQYRKKLIEVALPLEAINRESAREKSIRHGHPSTLHLWWARRPLAACRAVIFASLIDDPSAWPEIFETEAEQENERQRLFDIIEELIIWENSNNSEVLLRAQTEIARSIARNKGDLIPTGSIAIKKYILNNAPPVLDPFCGGGSIPLEAQRLGLRAYGSDLNPVAVLVSKAIVEIPPIFSGISPVNPEARKNRTLDGSWLGAKGLAEDVRYYGQWMRDEAERRIGNLYPKIKITEEQAIDRPDLKEYVGQELTVIAWLWARTVASPNPAVNGAHVPLVKSFWLSTKKGRETWVEPVINRSTNTYQFIIKTKATASSFNPTIGTVSRAGARCLLTDAPIPFSYIRKEGQHNRLNSRLIAIVVEGRRGRLFIPPSEEQEKLIVSIKADWKPTEELQGKCRVNVSLYGMNVFGDLFTNRQLLALKTFSELVKEARDKVIFDSKYAATTSNDQKRLEDGGRGIDAYADAVATYLSLGVSRSSEAWSSLVSWRVSVEASRGTFARQALQMVWDYCEINPFSNSCGNWMDNGILWAYETISRLPATGINKIIQEDATTISDNQLKIVSTDPPYYDNISYSDLSDYFYVWLRYSLKDILPSIFTTLQTPKKQELIASSNRYNGNSVKAKEFFEIGLEKAFNRIRTIQYTGIPFTVYYAFKQSEEEEDDNTEISNLASTGWDTMLSGLIRSGFSINGTWPIRTERNNRMLGVGTNALASSIVLVCNPRSIDAPIATRREFIATLKVELPNALQKLKQGNIAPVDLAQASIGPGMAIFTRYRKVIEADGSPMTVRTALALINQTLDEVLSEQEGEFDPDTRWAIAWFEQYGMNEGPYGEAETLSRAKVTAINGLEKAGIVRAKGGKVKLIQREDLPEGWDPANDERLTVWEATQYLIKALESQGETGAADLLQKLGGSLGHNARDLAYRLYNVCERKKWSQEALSYNGLILSWPYITNKLTETSKAEKTKQSWFE